jgi:hypothetical protein
MSDWRTEKMRLMRDFGGIYEDLITKIWWENQQFVSGKGITIDRIRREIVEICG